MIGNTIGVDRPENPKKKPRISMAELRFNIPGRAVHLVPGDRDVHRHRKKKSRLTRGAARDQHTRAGGPTKCWKKEKRKKKIAFPARRLPRKGLRRFAVWQPQSDGLSSDLLEFLERPAGWVVNPRLSRENPLQKDRGTTAKANKHWRKRVNKIVTNESGQGQRTRRFRLSLAFGKTRMRSGLDDFNRAAMRAFFS